MIEKLLAALAVIFAFAWFIILPTIGLLFVTGFIGC